LTIDGPSLEELDAGQGERWAQEVVQEARRSCAAGTSYSTSVEWGSTERIITFTKTTHGLGEDDIFNQEFLQGSEFRLLQGFAAKTYDLLDEDANIQRGDRAEPVNTFGQVVDWLMAEAKRGQTIQRYKGLGEMNPDQLWETTMNPESRNLVQVNIEDAVAADEVFSTLMGDQVEPRREFIENNALSVTNIDV
jgi:DNA gyrase subunit B